MSERWTCNSVNIKRFHFTATISFYELLSLFLEKTGRQELNITLKY
jgi:hypothetical protein